MALKNYTTTIAVEKTMMEIEQILAKFGATHIFKMYNEQKEPSAIAFKCIINEQEISFKLPMEEQKILQVFRITKGFPRNRCNIEQARKTGWRIIKDWVDSQMALIEINVVKFEEVFLPYMYDALNNETLFQKLEKNNFNLSLEYHGEDTQAKYKDLDA